MTWPPTFISSKSSNACTGGTHMRMQVGTAFSAVDNDICSRVQISSRSGGFQMRHLNDLLAVYGQEHDLAPENDVLSALHLGSEQHALTYFCVTEGHPHNLDQGFGRLGSKHDADMIPPQKCQCWADGWCTQLSVPCPPCFAPASHGQVITGCLQPAASQVYRPFAGARRP